MADLFDYLDWRGGLCFEQVPLTPVDALIFSALSYVHYDGLVRDGFQHPVPLWVVAEAFAALPDQDERVLLKNDGKLLKAAGNWYSTGTKRFWSRRASFPLLRSCCPTKKPRCWPSAARIPPWSAGKRTST